MRLIRVLSLLSLALLVGCGGGSQQASPAPASQPRALQQALAAPGAQITASALMDWAESAYPEYFPGHQGELLSEPYVYRFYPGSGNYLGVDGQTVSVKGPSFGTGIVHVGTLSDFACDVDPGPCTQTICTETTPWGPPYDLSVGNFRAANSWWGVSVGNVTPRSSFHQCMSARALRGTDAISASWNWKFDPGAVVKGLSGYPSIVYGINPASAAAPNTARGTALPIAVGKIRNIAAEFDIDMQATGHVQTFFDLYFASTAEPSPASMTHEVSISLRLPQYVGAHSPVGLATVAGKQFDVWVESGLPGLPNARQVVFVPRETVLTGTLKLKDVTDFLVAHKLMTNEQYLVDIELGTEPSGGEGQLTLRSYSITPN